MSIKTTFTNVPFTESPDLSQRLAQLDCSSQLKTQIRFYADEGYLILSDCFAAADIDSLVEALKIKHLNIEYKHWRRIQDAWQNFDLVKKFACNDKIFAMLMLLYQRQPIPFQTLNFCLGSEQKIHSDTIHFSSKPEKFMCGVWVALEDIDETNGPLVYYPQSHKLPIITMEDVDIDGSKTALNYDAYANYEDYIELMIADLKIQPVSMNIKKGDALIWSANLLHGGAPIIDKSRTRFSQVTHYYFENCLYYTPLYSNTYAGKLFYKQVTDIATGSLVANRYLKQNIGNYISNNNFPRRILNRIYGQIKNKIK